MDITTPRPRSLRPATTRHATTRHAATVAAALATALVAALVLSVPATARATAAPIDTLVAFDHATGEHPEGLAVASDGSLFVGIAPTGQLERVRPDGSRRSLGAPAFPSGAGYLLGLAIDGRDTVYGAVVRFDGGPSGVWRFDDASGSWELFAETGGFPNGLAFTADGTLLVADSAAGTIWAVDRTGAVVPWLQDPALVGGVNNLGVNGIALDRDGAVWFTNFDQGTLGRVRVDAAGRPAGPPVVVADDPLLASADGLAIDTRGGLWVGASYGSDRLLVVTPRGQVRLVADQRQGLDYTASLAFGRTSGTRDTLFVTNSGDDFATPTLMAVQTQVPGLPLRYP